MLTFIAGVVVGAFGMFAVMAALARLGDRVNDLTDYDADLPPVVSLPSGYVIKTDGNFGIGGGEILAHAQPTSDTEGRNLV